MSRWNSAYCDHVLMPDYRFASQYLAEYFLDAITAHVRTVRRLPSSARHGATIARLETAIAGLREEVLPQYQPDVPDLYYAFQQRLEAQLGEAPVSFLRMGLSRNDLDMTVYKMRARAWLLELGEQLCCVRRAVLTQAEANLETLLVAYTHHQPGQPTTVAHYLTAIDNVLARDSARLLAGYQRLNTCPLGAAALAGSSHPLDRHYSAQLLGFDAPVDNSYDAVASSDWQIDIAHISQSVALNLSRLVCDLLEWASQGVFCLPDGLVQGSSIMPQKRNPVALEHARTRFSRALGNSQAVLYSSHNIPYGDLNDFGPDIQGSFASLAIQLGGGLALLQACLREGTFAQEALERRAVESDTTATELADELTRSYDLSFQQAHRLLAALVHDVSAKGKLLQQATAQDLEAIGGPVVPASVVEESLSARAFVRRRDGFGGPAPARVAAHLQAAAQRLHDDSSSLKALAATLTEARRALRAPRKETL